MTRIFFLGAKADYTHFHFSLYPAAAITLPEDRSHPADARACATIERGRTLAKDHP